MSPPASAIVPEISFAALTSPIPPFILSPTLPIAIDVRPEATPDFNKSPVLT